MRKLVFRFLELNDGGGGESGDGGESEGIQIICVPVASFLRTVRVRRGSKFELTFRLETVGKGLSVKS